MKLVKQRNGLPKGTEGIPAGGIVLPPKNEFHSELFSIADWWVAHAVDDQHGGFYGEIDSDSNPVPEASKGIVLNSRLLWFFSALALRADADRSPNGKKYREMADRAFHYIIEHFTDTQHGGFYWEVDFRGAVVNDRKQVYAQAFCIYGFSAYFRLSNNSLALKQARTTFRLLEQTCVDLRHGGYIEAFSRKWGDIKDFRLSKIDRNYPKSMNTHLHVLEAYTALHCVVESEETAAALRKTIAVFEDHILDSDTLHLAMFMDFDWTVQSQEISYGHEIEYSWLVCEACHAIGDAALIQRHQHQATKIANQVMTRATGPSGEVLELDQNGESMKQKSIWWVQAEALVGYLNGYQISGDVRFLGALAAVWNFIQANHKTHRNGEWTWKAHVSDDEPSLDYLGGFWKGPYHNGRAMMELLRRIS